MFRRKDNEPPRPDDPPPAIDRTRERQLLHAAQRTATELTVRSESAFRRGLMPLGDYLE